MRKVAVIALVDHLPARDRQRLLDRLAELRELDSLIREAAAVRPPASPAPPGTRLSTETKGEHHDR
jgi:hypothetical protein